MNAAARRGACPALSAPMQTGDGLLVRLNPVATGLAAKQLIGLCESASRHGNGIVEITARGSFQIRGLTTASAAALAVEIDALGIAIRLGVPIDISPLAGLDPAEIADPRPLAQAIRAVIDKAALANRLGPKVSVVVNGGGEGWLDDVLADVRLNAVQIGSKIAWRIAIAGDARTARAVGEFDETGASNATLSILRRVADLGIEGRARDVAALKRLVSTSPPSVLPDISPARGEIALPQSLSPTSAVDDEAEAEKQPISPLAGEMSGRTEGGNVEHEPSLVWLRDSRNAFSLALPFGSIEAKNLAAYATEAATLGAAEFRFAPRRTLLVLTDSSRDADAIRFAAEKHGLIATASDPRLHIAACPGKPACASGKIATRAIAASVASTTPDLFDGSFTLHISGCAKGCAHPAPASLTVVGGESGVGLVVGGTAGHRPVAYMPDAAVGLARIAALVGARRRAGESAADCLQRLGDKQLARVAMERP